MGKCAMSLGQKNPLSSFPLAKKNMKNIENKERGMRNRNRKMKSDQKRKQIEEIVCEMEKSAKEATPPWW